MPLPFGNMVNIPSFAQFSVSPLLPRDAYSCTLFRLISSFAYYMINRSLSLNNLHFLQKKESSGSYLFDMLQSLVLWSLLTLLKYSFMFSFISTCCRCPLPIFPNTYYFPSLQQLLHFETIQLWSIFFVLDRNTSCSELPMLDNST